MRLDPFTLRRLVRFVEAFRQANGTLPTYGDFEKNAFDRKQVDQAVRQNVLEEFYVTLTSGTIQKGYKIRQSE